jgi:hypothetical protein
MIKSMGSSAGMKRAFGAGVIGSVLVLAACWEPAIREVFDTDPDDRWPGEQGRVGQTCIPEDDDFPTFAGFSGYEVSVSTDDPRCASGTCLVNRFQGRASCPDGNLDGGECFTPGGELVSVDVQPHLPERPVAEVVHCSCRCDGPAEFGPFCECPDDMQCTALFSGLDQAGAADVGQGSYCTRR